MGYVADVLLAGIWRDACIVHERTWHDTRPYIPRPVKKSVRHKNPVTLPRTIKTGKWGASADEHGVITRATHSVRPHYRALGDNRHASDDAFANAHAYGMPYPPQGFTFVRPHVRGTGESNYEAIQRVICLGLKTVKIALGEIK
jgi:hypothetical protein